jgi:hypothetical protein
MSYTAPPAFVSGDALLAAELNVLSDDIAYLAGGLETTTFSGCQIRRNTNQSVATSTDTYVTFTSEQFDYGGWWSSGTTVIVPAGAIPAGYTTISVMVIASVMWGINGTGKRQMQVHQNGAEFGTWKISAIDDDTTAIYMTEFTTVVAGDTIKLDVWQNSGSSLNITRAQLTVVRYAAAS